MNQKASEYKVKYAILGLMQIADLVFLLGRDADAHREPRPLTGSVDRLTAAVLRRATAAATVNA